VEDTMKEAPKKFDRYVRKTLDEEQYTKEYKEWQNGLEAFQKENPLHPSFDELYGKVIKKRKRGYLIVEDEGPNSKGNRNHE
jgi:thioester reductase-like protein